MPPTNVAAPVAMILLLALGGWASDPAPARCLPLLSPAPPRVSAFVKGLILGEEVPVSPAQRVDLKTELAGLVQVELDFSRAAGEKGIRAAFLLFLAERSVVFRPGPVDGRKAYSDIQESGGILSWYPAVADISMMGDFGYTSGPYEFRSGKPGDPVRYGNYASVWRRQSDGKWKVILDSGSPNPPPDSRPAAWKTPLEIKPSYSAVGHAIDVNAERNRLLEADRAFSARSQSDGVDRAYAVNLAEESRFLRRENTPVLGKSAIVARLSGEEAWYWEPAAAELAAGADLGYTHGILTISAGRNARAGEGKYYYTRFWKRDATGAWKVVLDVAQPFPPPQAKHPVSQKGL